MFFVRVFCFFDFYEEVSAVVKVWASLGFFLIFCMRAIALRQKFCPVHGIAVRRKEVQSARMRFNFLS